MFIFGASIHLIYLLDVTHRVFQSVCLCRSLSAQNWFWVDFFCVWVAQRILCAWVWCIYYMRAFAVNAREMILAEISALHRI